MESTVPAARRTRPRTARRATNFHGSGTAGYGKLLPMTEHDDYRRALDSAQGLLGQPLELRSGGSCGSL
jgi:hypothetical protein